MSIKFLQATTARLALVLIFAIGALGTTPVRARSNQHAGLINDDNTVKLEENTAASLPAPGGEVKFDLERGPVLPPLAASKLGDWFALGSNPAGADGTIRDISI